MSKIFGAIILLVLFIRFLNTPIGGAIVSIIGCYFIFKIFGPTIISLVKRIIEKIKYR